MTKTISALDYGSLHFTSQGKGKPVVLMHGLGSSLQEWDFMTPAIVEAGYQVYACDLLGHGASPKPSHASQYHIQNAFKALANWIDSLNMEEPFFLVGQSLGGYLALQYALQYPQRLKAMVLIDPFYSREQLPAPLRQFPQLFLAGQTMMHAMPSSLLFAMLRLPFMPSSHLPKAVSQQQTDATKDANPRVAYFVPGIPSLQPQLGQIQPASLVIWGEQDEMCNPGSFPQLITSLPHAQGFSLPGCGHHPHLEKPSEVSLKMIAFFASQKRIKGQ